jgi:hypothetical protein
MIVAAGTDGGADEIVRPVVVEKCRLVVQRKLRTSVAGSRGEVTEATEKALNCGESAGRGDNPAIGRLRGMY